MLRDLLISATITLIAIAPRAISAWLEARDAAGAQPAQD
jgi:hypothetical protein